jgi:molybdenum cofactor biosynthesis protein B
VLTISDTRTPETDTGGRAIASLLNEAGHDVVAHSLVPDEPLRVRAFLEEQIAAPSVEVVITTGGTGISPRDRTVEAVTSLFDLTLDGFGELFRMLSFQEIGAAAMLSRAVGGVMGRTVILTMPGSPAAVGLAMERLILPELCHLVREARR